MSEFAYRNVRSIEPGSDLCNETTTRQQDPDLTWYCTREHDHEGLHVAHNVAAIPVAAWNDTDQEEY